MKHIWTVAMAALVGLTLVTVLGGCAFGNKVHQAQITVQCSGERMLHLAAVPRRTPDGLPVDKARRELLEKVAEAAGGYTYIEDVMGGQWLPEPEKLDETPQDLLMVAGPPQLGAAIRQTLQREFQQEQPFVVSLPIQSVRVVQPQFGPPPQPAEAPEPAAAE